MMLLPETRDEFTVEFLPEVSRAEIEALNDSHGVMIEDSIKIGEIVDNIFLLRLTPSSDKDILGMANLYNEDPRTLYSVPDFQMEIILYDFPSDSFFVHQFNLHNTGQTGGKPDADIDAPEAWDLTKGLSDIEIVVIDKGVEVHEDFPQERLLQGIDWAGDSIGKPDNQVPDYDPSPGDSAVAHGMCCAGLAGASHNGLGVAGVAPNCKIYPVKIFDNYGVPTSNYNIMQAFLSTLGPSRKVYSCSWGYAYCGTYIPEVAAGIRKVLKDHKLHPTHPSCPVIFAAGNGGYSVRFPACMDSVIAVGATDSVDHVWDYSDRGPELDVVAPSGELGLQGDIWTVDTEGDRGYNPHYTQDDCENTDYTSKFGGTSAAAPQVAGLAALIRSQHLDLYPGEDRLSCIDIKDIICKSAEDSFYYGYEDTVWRDDSTGYGRINAFRALLAISRGEVNNDHEIDLADVTYLANYCFGVGPSPIPVPEIADVNCDGAIDIVDAIILANYLIIGDPKPPHCYRFDYPWN